MVVPTSISVPISAEDWRRGCNILVTVKFATDGVYAMWASATDRITVITRRLATMTKVDQRQLQVWPSGESPYLGWHSLKVVDLLTEQGDDDIMVGGGPRRGEARADACVAGGGL